MSRIRVLVLVNSLRPYGAENFVLNHVRHADRSRFEITVAHIGGSTALAEAFERAGVEVVNLAPGERRYTPATVQRLVREIRRRRIDVLQAHIALSTIVARLVGRATGTLVVTTEQAVRDMYQGWWLRAIDASFPLSHRHVFITRAVMMSFATRFPWVVERGAVITNGIDTLGIAEAARAARAEMRRSLGLGDEDFAFGNVGRLHPDKGQHVAIEALARVRERHPRATLWIVGEGELRERLTSLARDRGLGEAVHFLGERLDVHRLLGAFDAYVHPSTTEGLGIAILEALAAGLPTIASAVDGIPEIVRDRDTGWLFPSQDAAALAVRMEHVLTSHDDAVAVAARGTAMVRQEHDVRAAVAAYERLYAEALSERAASRSTAAIR